MFITEEGEGLSNSVRYNTYNETLAFAMKRHGYEWFYREDDCIYKREEVDRASVSAADILNSMKWCGRRSKAYQAMEWPRCGAYSSCNQGYCVPSHIIPKEIKDAAIILTLSILKGDIDADMSKESAAVTRVSLDKMSIEFKDGAHLDTSAGGCGSGMSTISGDKYKSIRHLIRCYLGGESSVNARFVRTL